jgi:hypothetical protein
MQVRQSNPSERDWVHAGVFEETLVLASKDGVHNMGRERIWVCRPKGTIFRPIEVEVALSINDPLMFFVPEGEERIGIQRFTHWAVSKTRNRDDAHDQDETECSFAGEEAAVCFHVVWGFDMSTLIFGTDPRDYTWAPLMERLHGSWFSTS